MVNLNNFINNSYLAPIISEYLRWYEIMPILLINRTFNKKVEHPFVVTAIKYYRKVDGLKLTKVQARNILKKTRENIGTELVETAILENIDILKKCPLLEFDEITKILNNSYENDKLARVDKEITDAIILSRCSLHKLQELDNNNPVKSIKLHELIYTYKHVYKSNVQSGRVINDDSQVSLVVNKTNMPVNYQYIFLYRFLQQRQRREVEMLLF